MKNLSLKDLAEKDVGILSNACILNDLDCLSSFINKEYSGTVVGILRYAVKKGGLSFNHSLDLLAELENLKEVCNKEIIILMQRLILKYEA